MQASNLPIHIICATRLSAKEFLTQSPTGITINRLPRSRDLKIKLFDNNKEGLGTVYNQAIKEACDTPAILVFIHDDIFVCDFHWENTVRQGLKKFDIVGIVGNTRRVPGQPGWCFLNTKFQADTRENMSGIIGHGKNFIGAKMTNFGTIGRQCKLLDGLFIAADSTTLHQTGLRFDPTFKFHFYDLDFCRQAELLALTMGTIPLSLIHASTVGDYHSQSWKDAYRDYIHKWTD